MIVSHLQENSLIYTSIILPDNLYQELVTCDVDPFESEEMIGSHHQFSTSILESERNENEEWEVDLTEDGCIYFLNVALPTYMEMWYTWNSEEGEDLLLEASKILNEFQAFNPY